MSKRVASPFVFVVGKERHQAKKTDSILDWMP